MPSLEQRIYELGAKALTEQERLVSDIRTRASTLLATSAVVASLLAKAAFRSGHPRGVIEIWLTAIGIGGAVTVLLLAVLLLRPRELGFTINASAAYRTLWLHGISKQPQADLVLADVLEQRWRKNSNSLGYLLRLFGVALLALIFETAGLGTAAVLASQ